ncbi:MAG: hypothetical protein JNK87_02235 [Bryobacterales bacterium]|nr:hypothetical protein [Bryobacterales bacterium]
MLLRRIVALVFSLAVSLHAQQTIFDVPSADVSTRHDYFYQHQTVARTWNPERQWLQTNAFGYGVGHHTELDVTWFNLDLARPRTSVLGAGFKTSLPLTPEGAPLRWHAVVGAQYLHGARAHSAGYWSYAMASGELARTRTKLTGGLHAGNAVLFGRRTKGFLGGVEQPLTPRWMFQADWFRGRHDLAYLIPGMVYRFAPHWMVSLGYQIPNRRSPGVHAAVLEFTRF